VLTLKLDKRYAQLQWQAHPERKTAHIQLLKTCAAAPPDGHLFALIPDNQPLLCNSTKSKAQFLQSVVPMMEDI
jgi:hypothetical protein